MSLVVMERWSPDCFRPYYQPQRPPWAGSTPKGSLQKKHGFKTKKAELKRWHYWLPLAVAGGALLASAINYLRRKRGSSKTVIVVKKQTPASLLVCPVGRCARHAGKAERIRKGVWI